MDGSHRLSGSNLEVCTLSTASDTALYRPDADAAVSREKAASLAQVSYPLEVVLCTDCGLSQLSTVVAPEVLYQNDYPYESSTTAAGRQHFARFAREVVDDYSVRPNELAIDVGSNVGVLVRGFIDAGARGLGVEPAPNIARIAKDNGIETMCEFFSIETARSVVASHGKARIITATNVFAHVDDLDGFMSAVDTLLTPDGLLIIEAPHFLQLVQQLEYDTIYHEHLSYLAVEPLLGFFHRHGFELIDVVQEGIHGGSFRLFVARPGRYPTSPQVVDVHRLETEEGICTLDRLRHFSSAVAVHRIELMGWPNPCPSDSALTERAVDYGLLLAWNFANEIMANLAGFKAAGGRFIIPIPHPTVI